MKLLPEDVYLLLVAQLSGERVVEVEVGDAELLVSLLVLAAVLVLVVGLDALLLAAPESVVTLAGLVEAVLEAVVVVEVPLMAMLEPAAWSEVSLQVSQTSHFRRSLAKRDRRT